MVYRYVVDLTYPNGGGPGVNIWHFRAEALGGGPQDPVDAIAAFYGSIIGGYQTGLTVQGRDEVVAGIEAGAPTYEAVNGFQLLQDTPAGSLPPAIQATVTWRTASATRSGRGRTFIGPLNDNASDADGTPTSAQRTQWQTAADALVSASLGDDGWAIGVWSPTDNLLRDFTRATVRDVFSVLRSRRD